MKFSEKLFYKTPLDVCFWKKQQMLIVQWISCFILPLKILMINLKQPKLILLYLLLLIKKVFFWLNLVLFNKHSFFTRTSKILMRLNILNFLKVFSLKVLLFCSYFLWNILAVNSKNYSSILSNLGYRIFCTILVEYKAIYSSGTFYWIKKACFGGVQEFI